MAAKRESSEKTKKVVHHKIHQNPPHQSHASYHSHTSHNTPTGHDYGAEHLNKALIENFVSLQKVMVRNAERMDVLSAQIAKLLQIFEISAKSFAERNFKPAGLSTGDVQKEAEFLSKLNTLLDQNKTIAKGLSLLGEDLKEKLYGDIGTSSPPMQRMPSLPSMPPRQRFERIESSMPDLSERQDSGFERKLPKI